ncbi:hypothetical protein Harman_29250 [Haloarcula mannanilytica]|uniref:Uncharacterized protein n=1 Tax=Haloarcula mannanilytica TaxID=2509225 RepID=A0A4C2ENL2_9EURY|nr:hypothetical protein Harman_29250 [Haloarcula mannanilytica]
MSIRREEYQSVVQSEQTQGDTDADEHVRHRVFVHCVGDDRHVADGHVEWLERHMS